jgi:hypothetical protein
MYPERAMVAHISKLESVAAQNSARIVRCARSSARISHGAICQDPAAAPGFRTIHILNQ